MVVTANIYSEFILTAILLHLSDIHIKGEKDPILSHANDIAICTYSVLPDASAMFILISGDIAYSGKPSEYEIAKVFLNNIKSAIKQEKDIPINFIIAAGNHDCDFALDSSMRQMAIKSLINDELSIDESVINQCTLVQESFFNFRNELISVISIPDDKLWFTQNFDIEGKIIIFDSLNLSWVSRMQETQGAIVFPHERYTNKENENSNIRIVVMHHPLNWFNQTMYRRFRQFVRTLASIIVTGHEHQANAGENIDTESSMSAYIEGGVLQDSNSLSNSAFNIVTLNLDDETYKSTRFLWKGTRYESTEDGSWAEYRKLPPKRRNAFEIQCEFRQRLDDPGANFLHPVKTKISLHDIYIYPSLLKVGDYKHQDNFASSDILLAPEKTSEGVLVEGEEKVGRTSLLYRLFDEYYERGYVPLYIIGSNIKKTFSKDIDELIAKAVKEQYGDKSFVDFQQLTISRKLLLLDDFDDCPIKSIKDRVQILSNLKSRFGHAIVTVSMLFEAKELLREVKSQEALNFEHYQIQPFGFFLRHKLIKKWVLLGNDGSLSESEIIDKIDQSEKSMDMVMGKNLIPSMPLYLLTLLQSIEAGHSSEFKDSSLGHYYDYLLNDSFLAARVPKEKLKEFFDYCTALAWHFHKMRCRELTQDQLLEFNKEFSSRFHTVDFEPRLGKLISSKVLIARGNQYYSFRYPYIYFFLKGRYLNQNIHDIQIRQYIEKCIKHLYVRENANTILFLAHHTHDEFVLDTVLRVLRELFSQYAPIKFLEDTGNISSLISDAPKLKYTGVAPEKFRENQNKTRDDLDDGRDGLVEKEEDGDALSYIAQLVTLFKTVEIIGQILKNKYSSLERPRKSEILAELFSGPLRALAGFYDVVCSNPDQLVAEVDLALKKRHKLNNDDERNRSARQIVAGLIQFASIAFIWKASTSVSSAALRENILETVKKNGTPAFRLIELGIQLDSASTIPRELLLSLQQDIRKDAIAMSLMRMLLIRHLYMFRTAEQDKQWLESKLGLDLGKQHSVELNSTKTKRIRHGRTADKL